MPPSITLDSNNNIITLSAGQRTITITSGEVTATEVPTEMENLAYVMFTVITTALVAASYMLVLAVAFGGRYLDEIKQSIEEGKAKAIDYSCRNHGNCPWCESGRQHFDTKKRAVCEADMKTWQDEADE